MAHAHHHAPTNFNKAFVISITLNSLLILAQIIYGIKASSVSLLADAGHNLGDVLGLAFAWIANVLQHRPASTRFSYGFRRSTIMASFANAAILIATSGIIAYEAIRQLMAPAFVNEAMVMIVATAGIVINGGTALLFLKGGKDDINIKGAFLHLAFDALISFGVVLGAIIVYFTGWTALDPFIGLSIVIFIVFGTWGLFKQSFNMMLDAVPTHVDEQEVRAFLSAQNNVESVHDLHIWSLGTTDTALTAHLVMPSDTLSDEDRQLLSQQLEENFKISHVTLQIEKNQSNCPHSENCIPNKPHPHSH